MRKAGFLTFGFLVVLVAAVLSASAIGSSPPTSSVIVPAVPGGSVTDTWTGTILPGANATSSCAGPFQAASDQHVVTINVPPGTYDVVDAQFRFKITWADAINDEILTVLAPSGDEVGSSDGGSNVETVLANN